LAKPIKEVRQTAIDVVDVEAGEFHWRFRENVRRPQRYAAVGSRTDGSRKPKATLTASG
jgi:hypothetical protein